MLKRLKKMLPWGSKLDVVLHIGAPKTGTSAIQRFCVNNREALLAAGFYYPEHPLDVNGISGGHAAIVTPLIKKEVSVAEEVFSCYLEEARQHEATLLLSAEGFYGQASVLPDFLKNLNVKVIGWFRDPVDALISNHNQAIKRHFATYKLTDFCLNVIRQEPNPYYTGEYLHGWADQVGDASCIVLPYRLPETGKPSIETEFLQKIGISMNRHEGFHFYAAKVNRSYVASALELKRLINSVITNDLNEVSMQIDWSLQGYSDRCEEHDLGRFGTLPENVIHLLYEKFSESNKSLRKRFPLLGSDFGELKTETRPNELATQEVGPELIAPLKHLLKEHPSIGTMLQKIVEDEIAKGDVRYSMLKLADLLGIPFAEPPEPSTLMSQQRLQALLDEKAQVADCLRELAQMMESLGDIESAHKLIGRAKSLRPAGPGILTIASRIQQKISKEASSVDSA